MGQWFEGDDALRSFFIILIVVSRQFGGGCSWGSMPLMYNRRRCFSSLLLEYLIISALTPRVCNFASSELVYGVCEFLHRERLHCVVVGCYCHRGLVSSSLVCGAPGRTPRTRPQCTVCRTCWCLSCKWVMRTFLHLVFMEVVFLRQRKLLKMFACGRKRLGRAQACRDVTHFFAHT